jgi:hypothetical protein
MLENNEENKTVFSRIGRRWRESIDKVKEYDIREDEQAIDTEFIPSFLFSLEYQKAQELKRRLLEKYKGVLLEEAIQGERLKTEGGSCYHIENQEKISINIINPEKVKEKILSNLKLIYGIGGATEYSLKKEGYRTIQDLRQHPRFGLESTRFLQTINNNRSEVINWIGRWFPKSHPLMLCASGLWKKEDFIILDIETMGFFSRPIILLGVAQVSANYISTHQYFLQNIKEEVAALRGFLSHINRNNVFLTFNGRTFDIPYIEERLAYYRMKGELGNPHFDILHFSRRAWKKELPNCRLTTLEKYLFGIEREDDVPSALVPEFYETYLRSKNIGPLIPIIEHNQQDLITLANIFSRLHKEWE